MILEKETFEKFGYYPSDLKPKSNKRILVTCDDCGKVRVLRKYAYSVHCDSCSKKGERSPHWKGGLVMRICEECGNEFPAVPANIKKGKDRFCNRKCAGKWQSKHRSGENSPSWKGGKIMRTCEMCGTKFPADPSDLKSGRGRFCSPKCKQKWMSKQFRGKNSPTWKGGKIMQICEICGTEFPVQPLEIKKGKGRFCSPKCHGKWKSKYCRGENNPAWKNGASVRPYCYKWNDHFREYIREKFHRICFLCDKTEAENGQRLSVHHCNENKNCGCDGDETCQFVPLCKNCHSKVHSKKVNWEKKIRDKLRTKLNGWYI